MLHLKPCSDSGLIFFCRREEEARTPQTMLLPPIAPQREVPGCLVVLRLVMLRSVRGFGGFGVVSLLRSLSFLISILLNVFSGD